MSHNPNIVAIARQIATKAHEGQTRWGGEPYITHPEAVVLELKSQNCSEETLAIGWLHDVLEDTDVTLLELEDKIGKSLALCVDALTHKKHDSYAQYIARLARWDEKCVLVKLADLKHNMSDLKTGKRKDKYELAHMLLELIRLL